MNRRYLLVLPLLCLCAWGSEKEFKLADGRVLRGELLGEKDGELHLALKAGDATAKLRVAKDQVVSVRDAGTARVVGDAPAAPQRAVAGMPDDAVFANLRRLLAAAQRETDREIAPPALDSGYPYPVWQHWPWIFTIDRPVRYGYPHCKHKFGPKKKGGPKKP
jgi:hypothetical protein